MWLNYVSAIADYHNYHNYRTMDKDMNRNKCITDNSEFFIAMAFT